MNKYIGVVLVSLILSSYGQANGGPAAVDEKYLEEIKTKDNDQKKNQIEQKKYRKVPQRQQERENSPALERNDGSIRPRKNKGRE